MKRFIKKTFVVALVLVFLFFVGAADSFMEAGMFGWLCVGIFSPFVVGWIADRLFNLQEIFNEQ